MIGSYMIGGFLPVASVDSLRLPLYTPGCELENHPLLL